MIIISKHPRCDHREVVAGEDPWGRQRRIHCLIRRVVEDQTTITVITTITVTATAIMHDPKAEAENHPAAAPPVDHAAAAAENWDASAVPPPT